MAYLETVIDFSKGSIQQYGANMLSYSVGESVVGGRYVKPSSSLFPTSLNKKVKARPISIELEFQGSNSEEVATAIAEFTKEVQGGADLHLPDGYGYFCVFDDVSAPEQITPWISVVEFEFTGIRHKNKATVTVYDGTTFNVGGMVETDAIIEITPTEPLNYPDVTIVITDSSGKEVTNLTVKSIRSESVPAVIVDGIRKKVTSDGLNKFGDTEMFEFPKLAVGKNTVSISVNDIDGFGVSAITISYYPLYL